MTNKFLIRLDDCQLTKKIDNKDQELFAITANSNI